MVVFFFFFKQKTAYEMRISDWSSDVCSSDLHHRGQRDHPQGTLRILVVRCAEEVVQMLGGGGFGHAAYLFRIAACSTRGVGVRGWKRRVVSGRSSPLGEGDHAKHGGGVREMVHTPSAQQDSARAPPLPYGWFRSPCRPEEQQ